MPEVALPRHVELRKASDFAGTDQARDAMMIALVRGRAS